MARAPLREVRWLTLEELATEWSRELHRQQALVLRELRLGVINLPRIVAGQGLIPEFPPDEELPSPDLAMRALLGDEAPDNEIEEPMTFGPDPEAAPSAHQGRDTPLNVPDWLKRPAPAAQPPQRLAAPSRLTEDQSAVSLPFGAGRAAALRRGRLIHALLQILPEITPDAREAAGRQLLMREPDVSPEEADEMLSVTLTTLNHPGFADVFAPGGRSEAAIVGTLPSGQMVNGRVDRLIIGPDQILIIDYKTDRPAPKSAADVEFAYRVQLAAYRAVLSDIYPDRPVRCALLYTDGPHLIEIPGEQLSESLNRVDSGV